MDDPLITLRLAIFAISVPHSIAAAQIGLGLSYVAWISALSLWAGSEYLGRRLTASIVFYSPDYCLVGVVRRT